MKLLELKYGLSALMAFRTLLEDGVVDAFRTVLTQAVEHPEGEALPAACAAFEAKLFAVGENWTEYLLNAVLEEESLAVHRTAQGRMFPALEQATRRELALLQQVSRVTLEQIAAETGADLSVVTPWPVSEEDFGARYDKRMAQMGTKGYGIFARHHVFTFENNRLTPVRYPDPQRLSQLPGYEREREKVIANTKALLAGGPANNVLLYGDAGTGKSSAIKAIANEFAPQGLRLVEVKKNQLYQIPELMDELAASPLKFILFIDDLSFTANDDNFAALKAILEGSVGGRAKNLAVYATSNRRHLIKESMSDRIGDDMHASDTRQELMSLSARFGLTVTFVRPDQDRYLTIVSELAKQYEVDVDEATLRRKAVAFADRAGGRSPRCAKQFIEMVKAGVPV